MEKAIAFKKTASKDEASIARISQYNEVLIEEASQHTEFSKTINAVTYISRTDMLAVIEEGSREIALFSAETARRVADLDFREGQKRTTNFEFGHGIPVDVQYVSFDTAHEVWSPLSQIGCLASSCADRTIVIWELDPALKDRCYKPRTAFPSTHVQTALMWSHSDQLLWSGSTVGTVCPVRSFWHLNLRRYQPSSFCSVVLSRSACL